MRKHVGKYDYGRCHVCGGQMRAKRIKQDFWIKGRLVVIDGVPAGVCQRCGEKVVRADVGRRVAELIEDSERLRGARTLRVPVIKYAKKIA